MRSFARAAVCLALIAPLGGCFLRKYVYHPVLVANAIGDSTTTLASTPVHVYATDEYELYGPTAMSVSVGAAQLNRAYREFAKHFGTSAPPVAVVVADSPFTISPADAGTFAKRRLHTFVYVRPHSLRDIEGVAPDAREEEIWPIGNRVAHELLAAYVALRRHQPQQVETATHGRDYHVDPFPFWFVDAVVALLSDPGAPDRVMDFMRDHLTEAPSLAELLDAHGTSSGGSDSLATNRDRRAVVGATGVALTLFAAERAGPRIVGRLADAFLAGQTARDALGNAQRIPQNDRDLERIWRTWVRDEYGR
jgi:hypothetical protein